MLYSTRCVIPNYTNWNRYVAFMRIVAMGIIAEFRGDLIDVMSSDSVVGYNLSSVLADLFGGTPGHEDMAREYRAYLCEQHPVGKIPVEQIHVSRRF